MFVEPTPESDQPQQRSGMRSGDHHDWRDETQGKLVTGDHGIPEIYKGIV